MCLALPAHAGFGGTVRVVDGDTLSVGGVVVRLYGIDAPEIGQTCQTDDGRNWDCGAWARKQVIGRVQDKNAWCETIDHDVYDRVVARCHVEGRDIGQALVEAGIALAYRKYSRVYDLDEKRAAVAGLGVHSGKMELPSDYRKGLIDTQHAPDVSCQIKGNISKMGERIFHVPGQRYYASTRIRIEKGERWFCSAQDAERAGWRRAKS